MENTKFVKNTVSIAANIALSSLFISANNVRKVAPSGSGIEELAVMIDTQGLLQALHVTAEVVNDAPTGRYAVEAGGRRLRALLLLAGKGQIAADAPIECRIISAAQALEVSLTENISQEGMHPADEFDAYQALVSQGLSVEMVAARFGVTAVHVQRRLKLSNVAPMLLDLYRKNEITLDQVTAFASTDDQERQVLVWNKLPNYNRQPFSIKRALIEDEVSASDARVVLVGLDVYIAAGGAIRTDLFSEDETQYLSDPVLLESLVVKHIQAEADSLHTEGWAWVEVIRSFDYYMRQAFVLPSKKYLPETPAQTVERNQLAEEMNEIEIAIDDAQEQENEPLVAELYLKQEACEAKSEALSQSLLDMNGADKSASGALVTFDRNGTLILYRGVTRAVEQKGAAQPAPVAVRAEVPEKLMLNLSSHRTAAIQASLIDHPNVALAALANTMALSVLSTRFHHNSLVKLNLNQCRSALERNSPTLGTSRAAIALDAANDAWKSRLPADSKEWFNWFLTQPQSVSVEMIVLGTAHCADAIQTSLTTQDASTPIANALSLDMADWWEATPASYLDLVPKVKIIEAVTDAAGAEVASGITKMKKGEACAFAASSILGKRWLPKALQTRSA